MPTRDVFQLELEKRSVVQTATNPSGAGVGLSVGSIYVNVLPRSPILNGASAGTDSGWLPISTSAERFSYQLDSGSTVTGFSVDISADGVTSLGQAFTGTWASSSVAEITFPIMFSNPLAKYFRWTVLSGGPMSIARGV